MTYYDHCKYIGNSRVNWFLDNKQIASQVKTEGERFSSNFVGRHGSLVDILIYKTKELFYFSTYINVNIHTYIYIYQYV